MMFCILHIEVSLRFRKILLPVDALLRASAIKSVLLFFLFDSDPYTVWGLLPG